MKLKTYLGWFFKEDEGYPSMGRLISFLFAVASVGLAVIMMVHAFRNGGIDKYEFYSTALFAVLAVLGKNTQRVIEYWIEKKT